MADIWIGGAVLTYTPQFKPGDPPPSGYCDWHAWAEVQEKAGLRQKRCALCSKWQYPQELSDRVIESVAYKTKAAAIKGVGGITIKSPVCLECAAKGVTPQ